MFLENSRYYKQKIVDSTARDGRTVKAVSLRILPPTDGEPTTVTENDRLDIMAHRQYADPTRYWHIADANTEFEANELTKEPGRKIKIPE